MINPKISVVMPVYNREPYLKESIESILNQTFKDFEFIIVDDSSTDSSWQIIQEYGAKDSRILAVKNSDKKGCGAARNFGWNLARGKYLAIMDSDDISLPKRLQTQFDFMEQNPDIDICGSWLKTFGANNTIAKYLKKHNKIRDLMFFANSIAQPSVLLKISSFEKFNLRYENCATEDYELWSRAIDFLKFSNIQEPLLLYRLHSAQSDVQTQNDIANNIRLRNVKNIGIHLSEEEETIYRDLFSDKFFPKNIEEIITAINIFEKISAAGKNFGYGEKFQELIKRFQGKITNSGIKQGVVSLKTYFTIFLKIVFFNTFRLKFRYIYYYLRNSLHL